jgi:CBS domain-containing protein
MARTIREVMTPDPVTLEADATLAEAARAMQKHDIGDVLVTRDGRLQGILTDRDIVVRAVAQDLPTSGRVGDIVSDNPMTVSPNDSVDTAIGLMRDNAIRRLPVVENERPVGIVSLGDLAEDRDPQSVLGQISSAPPTH